MSGCTADFAEESLQLGTVICVVLTGTDREAVKYGVWGRDLKT